MSKRKRRTSLMPFKLAGAIVQRSVRLRWKPVRCAMAYMIEWLDKTKQWCGVGLLEDDEIVPAQDGFLEYIDNCPGPMGPGGTYRVTACLDDSLEGEELASLPVVLAPSKPTRSSQKTLSKRLVGGKMLARVKSLLRRLKWTQHGWTMLLPAEAGTCLGRRLGVDVRCPELPDRVIDLLGTILANLPRLLARAEKAFRDYGGLGVLDEDNQIGRPLIVIDQQERDSKSNGTWTLLIGLKGSDYAWHIQFVRTRFKEIWAGD